jgi:hypothetical protein
LARAGAARARREGLGPASTVGRRDRCELSRSARPTKEGDVATGMNCRRRPGWQRSDPRRACNGPDCYREPTLGPARRSATSTPRLRSIAPLDLPAGRVGMASGAPGQHRGGRCEPALTQARACARAPHPGPSAAPPGAAQRDRPGTAELTRRRVRLDRPRAAPAARGPHDRRLLRRRVLADPSNRARRDQRPALLARRNDGHTPPACHGRSVAIRALLAAPVTSACPPPSITPRSRLADGPVIGDGPAQSVPLP